MAVASRLTVDRGARSTLPAAATRLVGREREVGAARERLLVAEVRLLTFTGPGGTGKTRLAVEVAASLADAFADGVNFVDLAPLRDPALVHATIARTLGIRDAGDQPLLDTLRLYLQPRCLLLVLDNFEQVIDAAALVADLLAACPALKIAVTCREPLHPTYDLVSVFLTSIAATKPTRDPRIGKVGHVSHTFGTLACAAIAEL